MTDKRRPASLSGKECSPKVWWGFPSGSGVKNLLTNAGDSSLIPGSRRSPGEGNGNPRQCVLAWEIPWTEEPAGLQPMGSQKSLKSNNSKLQQPWLKA